MTPWGMRSPLFAFVVTWIIEPLVLVGLYLIIRGWRSYVADRRREREEDG